MPATPVSSPKSALILLAHGSKSPQWASPFHALAQELRAERGEGAVYLGFMENTRPGLAEIARAVMATRVRRCRILPMVMAKGAHYFNDIPAQLARLREECPELEWELMEPIGLHPLFLEMLRTLVRKL